MPLMNVALNPSDKSGTGALSNGNLTLTSSSSDYIRATHGKTTGKWYWEVKLDSGTSNFRVGIATKSKPIAEATFTNTRAYSFYNGNRIPENTTYGTASIIGNIVGIALDLDNGTLEFYKNGVSMGVSHTDLKTLIGEVIPYIVVGTANAVVTFNFGGKPFSYPIPTGYIAYAFEPVNKILISSGNGFLKIKKGASKTYMSDTVIPTMTSGVSSIGTSFSSSFRASSQESWRAFDKNPIYAWISLQNSPITTPEWIGFNFNNPIKIEKYRVATSGRFSTPKDFIFQGSIDGVLWDDLDYQTISKATWTSKSNLIEFPFYNNKEYKQYRLYIISDEKSDSVGVVIDQLDMFTVDKEEVLPSISIVSTSTEQNFINHGMDKPIELDVASTISSRTFVEQSPTTLGSGKVFKKSIDTSQVPIKKVTIK